MAGNSGNVPVRAHGKTLGKTVLEGAGIKLELELTTDGHATLYRNGEIVYTSGDINTPADVQSGVKEEYPQLDLDATLPKDTNLPETSRDAILPKDTDLPEIGQHIGGKGIYVGTWKPKDRDGNSLGKTFNLFAAPEDVTNDKGQNLVLHFNDAVNHTAGPQYRYHGHDGFNQNVTGLRPDEALYEAIRTEQYDGEWFIPPKDVLYNNLYRNRYIGALKKTFTMSANGFLGCGYREYYWSCTEDSDSPKIWNQMFTDKGAGNWYYKDMAKFSIRLVRAEPQPDRHEREKTYG